jgi:hypothetical protein
MFPEIEAGRRRNLVTEKNHEKEPTENIYVRLPVKFLEELEHRCVSLRTSRPKLISKIIQDWLDSGSSVGAGNDETERKLAIILASSDTAVISAIRRTIDVFFDRLRPSRDRAKPTGKAN